MNVLRSPAWGPIKWKYIGAWICIANFELSGEVRGWDTQIPTSRYAGASATSRNSRRSRCNGRLPNMPFHDLFRRRGAASVPLLSQKCGIPSKYSGMGPSMRQGVDFWRPALCSSAESCMHMGPLSNGIGDLYGGPQFVGDFVRDHIFGRCVRLIRLLQ